MYCYTLLQSLSIDQDKDINTSSIDEQKVVGNWHTTLIQGLLKFNMTYLDTSLGFFLVVVTANTFIFSLEKKRKRRKERKRKEEGREGRRGGKKRRGRISLEYDLFRWWWLCDALLGE